MEHEKVHGFFHNISRVTIILPIIIIAIGIILKPAQKGTPQLVQSSQDRVTPTVSPVISGKAEEKKIAPISLTGPLVCTFDSTSDYDGMFYIKNKNIYADIIPKNENRTVSVLLKGDCVYKWDKGAKNGVKLCGVSQYVNILSTLSNFNVLDAKSVMTIISQFSRENTTEKMPENVGEPICKKDTVEDSLFTVPKTVQFQLRPTQSPSVPPQP